MIEIARQSRPRGLSRAATLLVVVAAAAVLASVLVLNRGHARHALPTAPSHPHERPALRASVASARWSTAVDRALANESRAVGLHLFTSSTGGAPAAAVRVAHWRPLIVRATRGSGFSPRLLEALVALESGGRAGAVAGSDPAAATGLTGLTAERARGFLHMHVDLGASRRLTLLIRRAEARHRSHRVRVLEARRRRADRRFVPLASLLGAVRDLEDAQRLLGQRDLAVAAYPVGLPDLRAVAARGARTDPPPRHLVERLAALGGHYYARIMAAREILAFYDSASGALAHETRRGASQSFAENVLHPRPRTLRFRSPGGLARAWRRHLLLAIPRNASTTHVAVDRSLGELAYLFGRSHRLYRGLRPSAREVLLFIGRRVHTLSHSRRPLIVTSAVRDERYQAFLMRVNANASHAYSVHTTGYAFDLARVYGSQRQAAALEHVLARLRALGVIAVIRESAAIHVAVASHVSPELLRLAA